MKPIICDLPLPQASTSQFCGIVSYAGEIAANVFAHGGKALTLQVGHYSKDPVNHTEVWASGIDKARDEVFLRAVCDIDPTGGVSGTAGANPFTAPFWILVGAEMKPSSIGDVLAENLDRLPMHRQSSEFISLPIGSGASMYMLRKYLSSIFAISVVRGVVTVPVSLGRGEAYEEEVVAYEKKITKREIDENVRDPKTGIPIYVIAKGANGKPIFEPVKNPKTGRHVLNPDGSVKSRVKQVPITQKAIKDFESLELVKRRVRKTTLFINIEANQIIPAKEFDVIASDECTYDPTWMLEDVLAGRCKDKPTYRAMGT